MEIYDRLSALVEKHREEILSAERYIWTHAELGYKEWNTHRYLKEKYEALGYELHEAGNIPGFYCDLDTGVEGPTVGVFGELDGLYIPNHPECVKETGAVHACGHHAQSAALLGLAAALKEPGALDGLCGKIRLFAVPAEELIELGFRQQLKEKGIIRYFGGKQEFMYRGYLDGVDLAFMIHTEGGDGMTADASSNGCIVKTYEFRGRATHASDARTAHNALYAANLALSAANALRETFDDSKNIRFHPIITAGGASVNAIPDAVKIETYIRGTEMEAMAKVNTQIDRAFAACAAAMGCDLVISNNPGYGPRINNRILSEALLDAGRALLGAEKAEFFEQNELGCSDMGDVTQVIPGTHPNIGGAAGAAHSSEYHIVDPVLACVTCAKVQLIGLNKLLSDGAALAKKVIAETVTPFPSIKAYLDFIGQFEYSGACVQDNPDGTVTLTYRA